MASIRQLPGLGGGVRSVESFALVREELIDLIFFYTQENGVRHLLTIVECSLVEAYRLNIRLVLFVSLPDQNISREKGH